MIVPVVVDDDRRAVVANEASAECLREQWRNQHLLRGAVGEHAPGEQHHPICPTRLREVMGREHDGPTCGGVGGDDLENAKLAGEIESGDRFVEQEQIGSSGDRLGDEDPLLLTTGQLTERPAAEMRHLEQPGGVVDESTIGSPEWAEEAAISVPAHAQHVLDRQRHPPVVVMLLRHHRNAGVDVDRAVLGFDQSGEQRQQRRLPAAVGSDERHRRATVESERRRGERDGGAVVHAHVVGDRTRPGAGDRCVGNVGCHENDSHSTLMRMVLNTRTGARMVAVACLAASGCGSGDGEPAAGVSGLVATTSIWADIASNVACGDDVLTLVPAGGDPHAFEPSLQDREQLERASLVVANGAGLEEGLLDLLATVADGGTNVIEMAAHIDLIVDAGQNDGHDDEGVPGEGDPHVWLDPRRVAAALDVIAAALIAGGRDAGEIERCLAGYQDDLMALDAELARLTDGLPIENRVLVTNHDSLAYFADRYGFEVLGTVIPSTSSIAETDPATLAALAATIGERGVPAIFVEESETSADAEALARRLGVAIVPLTTGSLAADDPASTYVGMLRTMTAGITEALAP